MESANGLTTFRRADGVEVTVMRPIPNPGEEDLAPEPRPAHLAAAPATWRHHHQARRHHRHHRHGAHHAYAPGAHHPARTAPARPATGHATAAAPAHKPQALKPTHPLPAPRTVEHPKPAAPPAGATVRVPIAPRAQVEAPVTATTPPAAPPAGSGEINVPGFGKASVKSLTGAGLLIAAMALLVLLARRMSDMGTGPRHRRAAPVEEENGIVVPKVLPEPREFPAESQPAAVSGEETSPAPDGPGKA